MDANTQVGSPAHNIDFSRLSHAYITDGTFADVLAMAVVCSGRGASGPCLTCSHCDKASRRVHPDITYISKPPDKREILVSQIREITKDAIVVPIESEKKVYVINEADLMNKEAQNAFLLILEDPPSRVVFILKTENQAALLPTVRSRCVALRANPNVERPDKESGDMADLFINALAGGNLTLTAFMFRLEKLDKESLAEFLFDAREKAIGLLKKTAVAETTIPRATLAKAQRILIQAGEMLELNVNTGHISGMICASLM